MKIKKYKKVLIILLLYLMCMLLSSCLSVNGAKVKLGLKNNDFEFINQGKVKKIIIQSTRDSGYRFEVTDKSTIADVYDILSTAKTAPKKTDLKPDYVLELQESSTVSKKFYYIAGFDKRDYGNFYSDNKTYVVSKRIDDDIMKNFYNIGGPKDFNKVYYQSIITALGDYEKSVKPKGKIGINIDNDVNILKYVLSVDIDNFENDLKKSFSNAELIENQKKAYDIEMDITTEGYTTDVINNKVVGSYKCSIIMNDLKQNKENKYYIKNTYANEKWEIVIYKETMPSDFYKN